MEQFCSGWSASHTPLIDSIHRDRNEAFHYCYPRSPRPLHGGNDSMAADGNYMCCMCGQHFFTEKHVLICLPATNALRSMGQVKFLL